MFFLSLGWHLWMLFFFIQAMLNDMEIMMKFILLSGSRGDL